MLTTASARANEYTILSKGQPAPYYGVLSPEDRWRNYEFKLKEADFFQKKYYEQRAEIADQHDQHYWWFIGGVAVGLTPLLLVLALK